MVVKAVVLIVYALVIIGIGIVGMRKTRTFSDFFLGGRSIGPWMTAFTYGTAYFSAVLFIGFAGKIGWAFGLSGLWVAAGNALLGVLAVWLFLGPKIRKASIDYQVATMSEYFEKRYESKFMKLFSPICIFIFFIPYSTAVFMGLAYLFTSNFNIDYGMALLFMGTFTTIYLVMGGYKSMAMMDVIFGMIMVAGVTVLFTSTVSKGGGMDAITGTLTAIDPKLTSWVGPPGLWPLFSLIFLTSVAPLAMPQLAQKFYAIKDDRSIRIGTVASTCFAVLVCGVAYFTGATTRVFISPETSPGVFENGKPVFDALMPELLANVIPESLSVLILLLILSASMSTLAALVLISSSSIAKDLYAGFINPAVSDRRLTLLMRLSSVFFIILSVILAYIKPAGIVAILGVSWGAIGSAFLGPFFWGLTWKRATRMGAVASSLCGLTACLVLYFQGMSSPEAGTVGMLISLFLLPIVSGVENLVRKPAVIE